MPSYPWSCLACSTGNPSDAEKCNCCQCPAKATLKQIATARRAVGIESLQAKGILASTRDQFVRETEIGVNIGTTTTQLLAAASVIAIALTSFVQAFALVGSGAVLLLSLVPGLLQLWSATLNHMFPFLSLVKADPEQLLFAYPNLFTVIHWCLLAGANAALVRFGCTKRPFVSAVHVILASIAITALLVWSLSLKFSHLRM
jgi:hypothetical protein